jgi:hypothetical protein
MDPVRIAGTLLLLGSVLFLFAAMLPALYPAWMGDLQTQLATIRAHPRAWSLCHACMTAAVILTAAGLGLLASLLAHPLAVAAAFAYCSVAGVWCVFEAYRVSVPALVARDETNPPPPWFIALQDWAGRLFTVYMLTAYLSLAGTGIAILGGLMLPGWSGWLATGFGVAGAVSLATGKPRVMGGSPFEPPVMIHVVPAVLGILLLLHG